MEFLIVIKLLLFSVWFVNCHDFDMAFPCTHNEECQSRFSNNSVCLGKVCACLDSDRNPKPCALSPQALKESKNLGGLVGRFCKDNRECYSKNTKCNKTTLQCQCESRYVGDSTNTRCLPIVDSIGGRCDDSKQCLVNFHNTTCSNNQCICVPGFHHFNGKCWKSVGFGENCTSNQECLHVDYAECNDKKVCACSLISIQDRKGEKCLPIARSIMEECTESTQCAKAFGEADCTENRCQCWSKSHFVTSIEKCVSNRGLGEACIEDYECYQGDLSDEMKSMKCMERVCSCAEKFTNIENKCVLTDAAINIKISSALIVISLLLIRNF